MRAALICDIKGSRNIENWREIFLKIEGILQELNKYLGRNLFLPFDFTVGDEFQGALITPRLTYEAIKFMKVRMPVDFYCGAGFGFIDTTIVDRKSLRGDAFYRARDAINRAKTLKRQVLVNSASEDYDLVINALLLSVETIEKDWTRRQREVINYLRLNPGITYKEIAEHFAVSRQNITKIMKKARFDTLKEIETAINTLLRIVNQNRFTFKSKPE